MGAHIGDKRAEGTDRTVRHPEISNVRTGLRER